MKNLFVFPTEKPSILHLWTDEKGTRPALCELDYSHTRNTQNMHITSDEEVKVGDWCIDLDSYFVTEFATYYKHKRVKKIILTIDQDLIEDGVQSIDNEFLEWFVKNPSCEEVQVYKVNCEGVKNFEYKIIIPKEEPKQGTIKQSVVEWQHDELMRINFEYATQKITPRDFQEQTKKTFEQAKEMEEERRGCNEVDMLNIIQKFGFDYTYNYRGEKTIYEWIPEWFEEYKRLNKQFKKK